MLKFSIANVFVDLACVDHPFLRRRPFSEASQESRKQGQQDLCRVLSINFLISLKPYPIKMKK